MKRESTVFLLSGSLGRGGAERLIMYLSREALAEGRKFIIILFKKNGSYLEHIPKNAKILTLDKRDRTCTLFRIGMLMIYILKYRPKVVFSNLWGTNRLLLASLFLIKIFSPYTKIVFGIQNPPHSYKEWRFVINFYKYTKSPIVCNSEELRDAWCRYLKVDKSRIYYIPNPTDIQLVEKYSEKYVYHRWFNGKYKIIINIGRLVVQKNHERLIRVFGKVLEARNDCRLIILGDGPKYNEIVDLINKMGLEEYVDLLGYQTNPFPYLKKSHCFVLTSDWEGFPSVLLEAMACKLPVVSTDIDFGPREIIDNGKTGYLCNPNDEDDIAKKICICLTQKGKYIGEQGYLKVRKNFTVKSVYVRYLKIFGI
ncbi:MAG: glycosyltransferase [Promethearchaeota archaeon]